MALCARLPRPVLALFALAVSLATGTASAQTLTPAGLPAGPARMQTTAVQQPQFGPTGTTYYRQAFSEFFPGDNDDSYTTLGSTNIGRYSSGVMWGPQPHLPGGAQLTYLELDFCDTTSGGEVVLNLYDCSYLGNCGSLPLVTLTSGMTEAPGCSFVSADLAPLNYTIDNFTRQLLPFVETFSLSRFLTGVVYGYKLQVNPAPSTATFTDVPAGHPFFQFVEALAASGITVGYPDGRYGVDDSITRGQMAVFLAKALGLHWEQ